MQPAGRRQKAVCWRFRSRCFLVSLGALLAACAPGPPILPTGAGAPFPEFKSAYDEATASCRAIKTITASMAMAGKAGTMKLRGRIDAGFEAPARARLEGLAPFGKPVFTLVADGNRGTLVLPREDRVLRDAPPDQIVEALAGVRLGPDTLRTVVTGCGLTVAEPAGGRAFPNGWTAVALPEGTVYLRKHADKWEVAAAASGPLTVTYSEYAASRPSTIRLRGESQGANADLTLRLSDVEINTTLHPKVFQVDLPEHAVPLTLDELRRAGPLGGGREP
jgi:outer membrane lipoprotein-sorting protein